MYTRGDRIITNKSEVSNYVEGLDFFNSKFLYELSRPELSREIYEITVYEYRPDLIARDFYGDVSYQGIVMLQATGGLLGLKRGNKILLVPKVKVDSIIQNL